MKLRTFLASLAVGCLATGFTACDDDDDDFVHPAAGEYFGTNKMAVMGSVDEDPNAVVKVISQSEQSVTVVLPESAKSTKGMELPSLTLKNLPILSAGGNKYAIALPTDTIKMQAPREDGTKMDIAIWGFSANVEGNDMELTYTIKMGRMPMSLVDVFEGSKKSK